MPIGIYKHKTTHGFQKGYIPWNQNKKCPSISKRMKGNTNGFKKGYTPHNKGMKGFRTSGSFQKGHKGYWLEKERPPFSEKCKEKMSKTKTGNKHPMYGKKHKKESIEKMSISRKGKYKGAKSANWKGGITPENKRIRSSIEFRLWREAVFARDNWTCQKCRIKSGNGEAVFLHPHHIKNFAEYPEFRFAIDNGITFCKKCHDLFHKKYGYKNNTRKQINEFLNYG